MFGSSAYGLDSSHLQFKQKEQPQHLSRMAETTPRYIESEPSTVIDDTDYNPVALDRYQRNWIIRLELDRPFSSMPKICRPKFVITDREPIDGNIVSKEYSLTTSVPPYREFMGKRDLDVSSANIPESVDLEATDETPDEADEAASEADSEDPYVPSDDFQFAGETDSDASNNSTFDSIPWPTEDDFGEPEDVEDTPSKRLKPTRDIPYDPLGLITKHTFVHCRLEGLETWIGEVVTIIVGYQEMEFIVPTFLLTNNFEFFRLALQVGTRQWAEGGRQTVRLGEESPVDFVLLLRFLLHSNTTDLNDLDEPCLPYWTNTNPSKPSQEYEESENQRFSMKPWAIRLIAIAERLCFTGPTWRLTSILNTTLKVFPSNRIPTVLMDWVFEHSLEKSVLRNFMYSRLLESLLEGEVDPEIYREYAEEYPSLADFLHEGMLERKKLKPEVPEKDIKIYEQWLEIFKAHPIGSEGREEVAENLLRSFMRSEMQPETYKSLVSKNFGFDYMWERILGLHNELRWRWGFRETTDHVENNDRTAWKGCCGEEDCCAGSSTLELGGSRVEFELIVNA